MKIFNASHFLRHISVPILSEFTAAHVLNRRLATDWTLPPESVAAMVCGAVNTVDASLLDPAMDPAERKAIEQDLWHWHDDLRRANLMSNGLAILEFRNACAKDEEAMAIFTCDVREIAMWMLAFRDKVFRDAELHLAFQAKSNGKYWKKHRIQTGLDPARDRAQLEVFSNAVSKLYEKVGGGKGSHVELVDRAKDGSVQLAIYVEGPVTALAHFEHNHFARITTRLALETAIVYHPSTGIVETIVKGGAKNHAAVLELFGTHVVKQTITPEAIEQQRFDLNALRDGMMDPSEDWTELGVQQVRLRRATFSPVGQAGVSFNVEASAERMKDDAIKVALASLKVERTFELDYNMDGASLIVYTGLDDKGKAGHFSFDVFSSGSSTIKNLSERNQPIANAVLTALNVIEREEVLELEIA